jgi:hypothetical protein
LFLFGRSFISLGPRFNEASWVKRSSQFNADASTDMCTAPVSTEWFRLVDAKLSTKKRKAADECEIPVTVFGSTGRIVPVIGYVGATSLVCDCACQRRVAAARAAFDSTAAVSNDSNEGGTSSERAFEHDVDPHRAVYHTATRDAFCAALPQGAVPTANMYFAYVHSKGLASAYRFHNEARFASLRFLSEKGVAVGACNTSEA